MSVAGRTPSLCFVIPYFGQWPFWMPFFLASCRANPSVDWLLFSDCGELPDCPPNVRVIATSYADYCNRVSARLGIDFHPANPYKLCDLKPALGYIHEAELAGYDFWGFGDIDLVWGDLRAYFTAERLAGKDLYATHARRVSGHCCLLRNTADMRELFRRMPNWQQRLVDNVHHALDEGAFSRIFIRRKNWPQPLAEFAGRFNRWRRRAEFIEAFSTPDAKVPWVDGGFEFPSRWSWDHGRLTNDRDGERRFPYFHFVVWKKHAWRGLVPPPADAVRALAATGRWVIDAQGFHAADAGAGA
ncbi:DUF6625 family protein [Azoarcus olearius]|uniref:Uncharacterized protein n=1 Tax=Azoarcus sp. (strain BH72) TaxID=418699 RepID=A1KBI7_AZOSB|nr:DUF6625 family protein [Azoarcus olearius]ANQ86737.1 hypothetical protein dqs_3720 [Azoarcus olearius]CAL96193.1 hypothetical protein predicted by Glimmer/Critica [Azoarcus olearius]